MRPKASFRSAAPDPERIARKNAQATERTLLFYWLGGKQSYLWAITPARVTISVLPPRNQIAARVKSYNNAILNLRDLAPTPIRTAFGFTTLLSRPQ